MRLFRPAPLLLLTLVLCGLGCTALSPSPPEKAQPAPAAPAAHAPLEHTQATITRSTISGPPPPAASGQVALANQPPTSRPTPPAKLASPRLVPAKSARRPVPSPPAREKAPAAKPPKNLDQERSKLSQHRRYKVSYQCQPAQARLKRPQEWKLKVLTKTGKPVTGARVRLAGASPQNGHKANPASVEARNLGHGYYLAKGLVFSQPGWWVVTVEVVNGGRDDRAQFNVLLK
ncbi:MAG: FixH family protein [Pseudomonadota bacterium]